MTTSAVRPAVGSPTEEPVVKDGPDFAKSGGMIPVVAQDAATGEVLMLAFMNDEAWRETLRTGRACYYSRSRDRLWRKGEESGHFQEVREIRIDCDRDTIVLKVVQHGGAACHTGHRSCFFRRLDGDDWEVEGAPVFDPAVVYGSGHESGDKASRGGRA